MQTFFTEDFRKFLIKTEGGPKFSFTGFFFIKDKNDFLKNKILDESVIKLELGEIKKNTDVFYKNGANFPLKYIPAEEFSNTQYNNSFGNFCVEIDGSYFDKTQNFDAVALIGTQLKENLQEITLNENINYLAGIIYFEEGLEVEKGTAKHLEIYFEIDDNNTTKKELRNELSELYQKTTKEDNRTDKISQPIILAETTGRYSQFGDNIPLNNNLVIGNYEKKDLYNIKPRVLIFNDKSREENDISISYIKNEDEMVCNENFCIGKNENVFSMNFYPKDINNRIRFFSDAGQENSQDSIYLNSSGNDLTNNFGILFNSKDNVSHVPDYQNGSISFINSNENTFEYGCGNTIIMNSNKNHFQSFGNTTVLNTNNMLDLGTSNSILIGANSATNFNTIIMVGKNELAYNYTSEGTMNKNISIGFEGNVIKNASNKIVFGNYASLQYDGPDERTGVYFTSGRFNKEKLEDPNFDLIEDLFSKTQDDCLEKDVNYLNRLNTFSIEENTEITYVYEHSPREEIIDRKIKENSFIIRSISNPTDLIERNGNLQECYFTPEGIFFPREKYNKQVWPLSYEELYYITQGRYNNSNKFTEDQLKDENLKTKLDSLEKRTGTTLFYEYKVNNTNFKYALNFKELLNKINGKNEMEIGFDYDRGTDDKQYVIYITNVNNDTIKILDIPRKHKGYNWSFGKWVPDYETIWGSLEIPKYRTLKLVYYNDGSNGLFGVYNINKNRFKDEHFY